ncbi:FAD:protein FMN transferase [Fulvivirga sediminis]|uniref:FAD:protein FMN transferase n=1 Tax=Fulvivirga sediminis TaxID=2803949 RepID=A0A937F9V6_9BACT|nr:FAD:protein FMN transferase [Fulvivirga sediminis]MBL3657901.1 FAD:protein FMN transferase [Fulvivirga sediminis]
MSASLSANAQNHAHKKVLKLMGSRFEITAVSDDEALAWQSIDACIEEITRIEKVISSWDERSQTAAINRNAGIKSVIVDPELFNLIVRAKKISNLTDGAFDVSYASVDKIWKFDGSMQGLPSAEEVAASVAKIDYHNIILNAEDHSVFLKEKGMKIGFGAIGKGYAANKGREIMKAMGITSGIVNASGDLLTWGKEADGSEWSIGIADPKNKRSVMAWLAVGEMAVVTSGNYEKFIEVDGKRYSHIIDPRTGYPVQGLKSVTIICPDAELSDALATSVFVLGKEKGMALINQLNGIECFLVDDKDELSYSKNLKLNYYKNGVAPSTDATQVNIGHEAN